MKLRNADALRRAMDHTRAGKLMDATALIQRTLNQHGLAGDNLSARPDWLDKTAAPGRLTFSCAAGSRDYVLHVPAETPKGLLMMLHGCTQNPEDFAVGTHIVRTAHAQGYIVCLPAQSRGDNAQSCWNWFSGADQHRDRGEPAILAGLASEILQDHGLADSKAFVAGLSAGGAMAVILGETYPDVFAGVGVHSGLPYGCARGVSEAFTAMGGTAPRTPLSRRRIPVPAIVFHGSDDHTVAPVNAAQIISDTLRRPGAQTQIVDRGRMNGRSFTRTTTLQDTGAPLAELWEIDGLAHAWSGGDPAGSHTDAKGPDASAEMLRFFSSITADAV